MWVILRKLVAYNGNETTVGRYRYALKSNLKRAKRIFRILFLYIRIVGYAKLCNTIF